MIAFPVVFAAAVTLASAPPDTLVLSLEEAIERARLDNHMVVAARAEAAAAEGRVAVATQAFLPTVELGVSGVRSTDPVATFGLKLRQEAFGQSDLALDALNRPAPYGGFGTAATVKLPVLSPDGLFGHRAARRMARARAAEAQRTAGVITFRVIEAYWTASLAAGRVEALDAALRAARAHVARAEALRDQGLATGLDARLARVQAATIESERIAAAADAASALEGLAFLAGLPPDTPVRLADSPPAESASVCGSEAAACDLDERADLVAAQLGQEAAAAGVQSAWGQNLPSVALFGSVAHHARSAPWGAGSGDWTIGVMVSWNVLRGLAGAGVVREARAQQAVALAQATATRTQAALEAAAAGRRLVASRERLAVARAAQAEAAGALAQAQLRYDQGLSPISELLDVQASATATILNFQAAQRDLLVAQAALDLAYGVFDR